MNPEDGKHDIGPVLESYGAIIPHGTGWRRMCCPLHNDHTPSASVNYELSYFRCWPCDFDGDVYDLIMHVEGIGFREAQQFAEAVSGPIGDDSGERAVEQSDGSYLPDRAARPERSRNQKRSSGSGAYGSQWS